MNVITELARLFEPAGIIFSFCFTVFIIAYISNLLIKKRPKGKIIICLGALFAIILLMYPYFYLAYPKDTVLYLLKALISVPLIFYVPGYVTYIVLHKEKSKDDFLEAVFLQILSSILISGWIAFLLMELGCFSLFNLLVLLIVFSGILSWKYKVKFRFESFSKPSLNYKSITLIVILVIAITLFFHPYPWILGGVDTGVYVNTGVNIAKTGSAVQHDSLLANIYEFTKTGFDEQFPGFPITNKTTGEVRPGFFYLWPTIIAIFYSIFGLKIGLYVTSFFALLSILSIYFTGKILFNKNVGLIASLLLALNFAQIWYARCPATEVFTQLLIFSGLFTFILFSRTSNGYFGVISALCFGESFLTRVDTIFLVVPIILFFGYLWLSDRLKRHHLYFVIPFISLCIHAIITAGFVTTSYTFSVFHFGSRGVFSLINDKPYLSLLGFIAIIAFLILLILYKNNIVTKLNKRKKFIPCFLHIASFLIFIFVIYAFFIRPSGTITSNSYNLVKLSWYLSGFYGILLATSGFVLLMYKRDRLETFFFLTTLFIYAVFFIIYAYMSPGHPWWIRRYLPVVIPGAILCISYFVCWIKDLETNKTQVNKIITIILLFFFLIPSGVIDSKIICHTEYNNAIEYVDELSNIFENNSIILYHKSDFSTIKVAAPLFYIHGKEIGTVPFSKWLPYKMKEWINSGKTVYFVDMMDIINNDNGQLLEFYVNWTTFHSIDWGRYSYFYVPDDPITEEHVFSILVLKKDCSQLYQILGSNWYRHERWQNIATRWTSNNASILVYSTEDRDYNLSFNVISFYKPRNFQIYLNGGLIHAQKIPTSFVEVEIPVKLKVGENIIRFYTPDGCQRPVDIPELKNKEDSRCLSLAFQTISLTEITNKSFMTLSDNWYDLEELKDIPTRWSSNNATINIYSTESRHYNLSFNVVSFYQPRNLKIYLNDGLIHAQKVPTCFVEVEIPVKLKEGDNRIRFYTQDGCQRPVDIPELKNGDSRCLSLAFQTISLTEITNKSFMTLSDNWYDLEELKDIPTRWSSNNATINIYSTESRHYNLSFNVVSFYQPRNLKIYLNDGLIHAQKVPTCFVEVEIPVKLKEGDNRIRFYTQDGCQRPVDIPELKNGDSRCLCLAFQNITLI